MTDLFNRIFAHESFQSRERRVLGVATATVDTLENGGLYRLKIHGMNGQDGDDASAPARVMMPMASSRYGAYFFPEQGDEVIVAFVQGDPNMPVILGAVYNSDSVPPAQAKQSTDNNVRAIVSRSGHQLTFDDTAGAEKITLQTQGGHSIVFDDSPTGPKITISSASGRRVVLDDTPPGQISIQTPTCEITLAEPGQITIQATAAISLSAPSIRISGATVSVSSAVTSIVDGVPFLTHTHGGPPPTTGTVTPVPQP